MKFTKILYLTIFYLFVWSCATSQTIFINEIGHLATTKGIEVAGPAISNLAGWEIVIYNENGLVEDTLPINAIIPDFQNGFGFIWVEVVAGFQGPSGGAALIDDSNELVQFLSYGEEIKGDEGIATDITSELIGTQTEELHTLQLTGEGNMYSHFVWDLPGGITKGELNNGQTINQNGGSGLALPVEWIYFNGTNQLDGIQLKWATDGELNNEYFRIEHSFDGKVFEEIDQILGKGNSTEIQEYQYYHKNDNAGTNYYRLTQVDFNGNTSPSDIIQMTSDSKPTNVRLFPNPVNDDLWISTQMPSEEALTVEIFNTFGKRLLIETFTTNSPFKFDLKALPNGSYFVVIKGETTNIIQKILKK